MTSPGPCKIHECVLCNLNPTAFLGDHRHPISVRGISDPLQRAVILHCPCLSSRFAHSVELTSIHPALNTKERVAYDDISSDSRFSSEAHQSPYKSVLCLPIFSNRGQTFGALYLASKYAFSKNTITLLTLLCQQANISVANALLFRSVQAGTKENLRMISAQKDALEDARQSREDALKATRVLYIFFIPGQWCCSYIYFPDQK